jgi:hypothetical protein
VHDAFDVIHKLARKPGAVAVPVPGPSIAFYSTSDPASVYAAFPHSNYQIEVYDPSARTVRQLVGSGHIVPIR